MSPVPGHVPDGKLDLDLMGLVGKLHRQAAIASRSGQMEDLEEIARDLTMWQARCTRAFMLALGEPDNHPGWVTIVNQVAAVRHERDGMQLLHTIDGADLIRMEQQFEEARQELDRMRKEKRDA
jgi:hypothetical protein